MAPLEGQLTVPQCIRLRELLFPALPVFVACMLLLLLLSSSSSLSSSFFLIIIARDNKRTGAVRLLRTWLLTALLLVHTASAQPSFHYAIEVTLLGTRSTTLLIYSTCTHIPMPHCTSCRSTKSLKRFSR